MRRNLTCIIMMVICALIMTGCNVIALPPAASPSILQASPTPSTPSPTPAQTVQPNETAVAPEESAELPNDYKTEYQGWIYYLDVKNPVQSPDSEEALYFIHRMKPDGSGDESLKITGFHFDFAEQNLYVDTNLSYGDFGHWETYRYNPDGTGKKDMKTGNMKRFYKDGKLYYSLFDESALYISAAAGNNAKKYEITIPDEKTVKNKVGNNWECNFVTVTDAKDGWVYFNYEITDTGPMTHYEGGYRMNTDSKQIEKTNDGEYS